MSERITQHCLGLPGSGGPAVALDRLVKNSSYTYGQIRQLAPAGGISFRLIWSFIKQIRQNKPDLIHIRGLGAEGFHAVLAARIAGVRIILVSIHGTQRDLLRSKGRLRAVVVSSLLEPLTLMMATHIATVCEYAEGREFLNAYRHKLVGVVPNGVEVPEDDRADRAGIRKELGIPEDWSVGICVSRLTVEKGFLVLADALLALDERVCKFALIVVGGGDEDGTIKNCFDRLVNIRVCFVGHQLDTARYLSAANFFIFPTLHENLSNALLEAMMHRLPVIATAVGGNVEVLKKGGGMLVPSNDSEALVSAIYSMLSSAEIRSSLGRAARENVENHYTISQMVSGWESLYSKLLGIGFDS
jgi:glycosyltransferase involved in cell wall biosynthesis